MRLFPALIGLTLFGFSAGISSASASPGQDVSVVVNGAELFPDSRAYIQAESGLTYVPLRSLSEAFGTEVDWSQSTKTATVRKGTTLIDLTVGSTLAHIDGREAALEASAEQKNGRVMVPVRFIAEALGIAIAWNADTRTVTLGDTPAPASVFAPGEGNDIQNILNQAFVTQSNGWVYYQNVGDESKLYRMKEDGSQSVKITDDPAAQIQVTGGWVYYRLLTQGERTDAGEVYRIRPDGTERTKLSQEKAGQVYVTGDWIYYNVTAGFGSGPLFKMRLDGSGKQELSQKNEDIMDFVPYQGRIYYKRSIGGLYSLDLDGRNRKTYTKEFVHELRAANGFIYYHKDANQLLKMSIQTGEESVAVDNVPLSRYYVGPDYLVLEKALSFLDRKVYLTDLQGGAEKLRIDNTLVQLNVIGDWIYFMTYETKSSTTHRYADIVFSLGRVKKDGSQREIITSKTSNPFPNERL
ncbi:DUF5050 domain-containing protein [Paenibacillus chitinolyticus]|uniref:DUF5050 domain-containing protein n=1 Tax=Paenibacillus chitinolyticus TaxID=79263 RepID=UPI0036DED9EC